MSAGRDGAPLRLALLDQGEGNLSRDLGDALARAGHDARVLARPSVDLLERLLARRGFTPALTSVPGATAALVRGGFDLVHAFSPTDAVAALAWRRLTGRPAVFTCVEALARDTTADARLRLYSLRKAVEESDAVIAADEASRAGLERWFALSPAVIPAEDALAHVGLYRQLAARGAGPG